MRNGDSLSLAGKDPVTAKEILHIRMFDKSTKVMGDDSFVGRSHSQLFVFSAQVVYFQQA
jgi:hypothetical protein